MSKFRKTQLLGLAFCSLLSASIAFSQPIKKIVVTLPVYQSITQQIAGDTVLVTSILLPRSDPHSFEPRPSDITRVLRSDLFIYTGLDMESWRKSLVTATGRLDLQEESDAVLDLSKFVDVIESLSHAEDSHGIHVLGNPHYWLAPKNGQAIAKAIATRLTVRNPESSALYAYNLVKFEQEVSALESKLDAVAKFATGKKALAYHDEWSYLTKPLGLEIPMYLEPHPGMRPSPSGIKKLKELLKTGTIACILLDGDNGPDDLASSLALEGKVPLVRLAQQPGDLPGTESYAEFMSKNISLLSQALGSKNSPPKNLAEHAF